ncbi:hypothetical protein JIN77_16680 [Verrucomicrobiaceae bacterium R5-34]|nr:hypothetical protein [Verrucomicrobiaceae bacterium R5-34]
MNKDAAIHHRIFSGSDHPLDSTEPVYEWFHKQIDEWLDPKTIQNWDRCEVCDIEVYVAMLYTLTSTYHNEITTEEHVRRWRDSTIEFFDKESLERGDSDEESITQWRWNILSNFARLERVCRNEE